MDPRTLPAPRRHLLQLAALCVLPACLAVLWACGWARRPPSPASPIVILVSFDGFRPDYIDRFGLPTLSALAARGVRAKGLVPQFPGKTFPNHYTVVTGLRPAHHGIVSNNMRAPDIPGRFSLANREAQLDPRWWGGEPVWNTVERQGRIAANMFWPGSETAIGGRQATYWHVFDDSLPNASRVVQVLDWLGLPQNERPSLVTLYFSDVDTAGHRYGPDADETREAAVRVDAALADLVEGVERLGLADRVHYVVVSDHGMLRLSADRVIVLDDYIDLAALDVIDWTPVFGANPRDGDVDAAYARLAGRHPSLAVYRNEDLPPETGLAGHARMPAIVGIAAEGWHVTSRRDVESWTSGQRRMPGGNHGFDPHSGSERGLFVAAGPRLREGLVVPAFENIHVYELMCALLDVTPAPNDGDRAVVAPMLR